MIFGYGNTAQTTDGHGYEQYWLGSSDEFIGQNVYKFSGNNRWHFRVCCLLN